MGTNKAQDEREALRVQARHLGRMVARVGDFFDIAEGVALGYAIEAAEPTHGPASAAYSESGKSPAVTAGGAEANSTADQGPPAPPSAAHLRWELVALNELQAVCADMIEWRVDDARRAGMSWQKIGDALEISRTTAHMRYGRTKDKVSDVAPFPGQTNLDV